MDHTISKDYTQGREEVEKRILQAGFRQDMRGYLFGDSEHPDVPENGKAALSAGHVIYASSLLQQKAAQQAAAQQAAQQEAAQQEAAQLQAAQLQAAQPPRPPTPSQAQGQRLQPEKLEKFKLAPKDWQKRREEELLVARAAERAEAYFKSVPKLAKVTHTKALAESEAAAERLEQGNGIFEREVARLKRVDALKADIIASDATQSSFEEAGCNSTIITKNFTANLHNNHETTPSCADVIDEKTYRIRDPKQLSLEQVGVRTQRVEFDGQLQATGTQNPDELNLFSPCRKRRRDVDISLEADPSHTKLPRTDKASSKLLISGLKDKPEDENCNHYSPILKSTGEMDHSFTTPKNWQALAPTAIESHVAIASDDIDTRDEIPWRLDRHLSTQFGQNNSQARPFSDHSWTQSAQSPLQMPLACQECAPTYAVLQEEIKRKNIAIEDLRRTNSHLRNCLDEKPQRHLPSRWLTIHKVQHRFFERLYEDTPQWTWIGEQPRLEGLRPIGKLTAFLQKHTGTDVAFLVFHVYNFSEHAENDTSDHQDREVLGISHKILSTSTQIQFLSSVLATAFDTLLQQNTILKSNVKIEESLDLYDDVDSDASEESGNGMVTNMDSVFYHFRSLIEEARVRSEEGERQVLDLLIKALEQEFSERHQEVRELFAKGYVTSTTIKYLFKREEAVVFSEGARLYGAKLKSIVNELKYQSPILTESWAFDGKFYRKETQQALDAPQSMLKKLPTKITSLPCYPLSFADEDVEKRLQKRGRLFWECRRSAYVAYNGRSTEHDADYADRRFLIDVRTYHTMHGNKGVPELPREELEDQVMVEEEPPDYLIYMVPEHIFGFDMQEKNWVNLEVDKISEIQWNKEAFKTLAIQEESKELVDALINNKIKVDKATDRIKGKGNGLILLLHGGPGTGKTLTAESVAEIAEKPLYRVTCGDIGTEPQQVEEYLQKVFHLGRIWECVVLLDEADVFLEQRTLSDLTRNALVSVFLRTLEYYDGILILTSNRVGTFDEAFKSRIQLALHYKELDTSQREQIWTNFIDRLGDLGENFNAEQIRGSIKLLAKYKMNGRQIRNAITTARQLALFRKTALSLQHLQHSIKVSSQFDKYLEEVHDHIGDEDMARQDGVR